MSKTVCLNRYNEEFQELAVQGIVYPVTRIEKTETNTYRYFVSETEYYLIDSQTKYTDIESYCKLKGIGTYRSLVNA